MSVFLISIGLLVLFFLLGRELICWYFKINRITQLLEEISDSLRKNNKKSD